MSEGLGTRGLVRRFGPKTVLDQVAFHVGPGEVVGLLGENGAGKTTLLRIVSGFLAPSEGTVELDGHATRFRGPRAAAAAGIGMVHQHFLLIPELTVAENVLLGREPTRLGVAFDREAARAEVADCAARFGLDLEPDAKVGDLDVSARQRVELVKVLVRGTKYLLLDEPTGLLPPSGVRDLFALVERLAAEGCGVVLVTHRLPEVFAVCSKAHVLRRGRVVADQIVADTNERELARAMIGEDLDRGDEARAPAETGEVLLSADGVGVDRATGGAAVRSVSLQLRAGEVVGLAGVSGSGQRELLEALAGVRPVSSGDVRFQGGSVAQLSCGRRRRSGMGYAPADRLHEGLVSDLTVAENLVLTASEDEGHWRRGWLALERIAETALAAIRRHDVRPPDPEALAGALSGGNQQKVLLARELSRNPRVLLADEPARGLDFRAAAAVHSELRTVASEGGAVLFASTDLPELLEHCDRVLVMYGGAIAGEVDPRTATEDEIGLLMTGGGAR